MALQTRKPTGQAGFPSLIVEGKEKAGKTHQAITFTADPRIGRAFVVEVGENRADEYAALGRFDIVEHDGRIQTIVPSILDVMALPPVDGKPTLLIVDSGTATWDLVKRAAETKARSSHRAKAILEKDPDAEIEIGHQAWNVVTDRWWWSWVNAARGWPGILVITARADEVSKFENGQPVKNQTEYRVDIQKGTPFAVDGSLRIRRGTSALLTAVASLKVDVPADGLEVPRDGALAHVVFDLLGAGTSVTLNSTQAKLSMIGHARVLGLSDEQAKAAAAAAWGKVVTAPLQFTGDGPTMSMLVDAVEVEVAAIQDAPGASGGTDTPGEDAGGPEAPNGAPMAEPLTRRLHLLLRKKRNAAGDGRFPVLTEILGRPITSSKQLTQDEGIRVCEVLDAEPDYVAGSAAPDTTAPVSDSRHDEFEAGDSDPGAPPIDPVPESVADDIVGALVLAAIELDLVKLKAALMERHEAIGVQDPDDMRRRLVVLQAVEQGLTEEQVDRFYTEAGA
jgi:hypothetical protein